MANQNLLSILFCLLAQAQCVDETCNSEAASATEMNSDAVAALQLGVVQKGTRTAYINQPSGIGFTDLEGETIDTSAMDKTTLMVPSTSNFVDIYVYKSDDDKFVSASVKSSHSWETDNVQKLIDLWKDKLPAGSVGNFLDVGGNIGTFSLPVSNYISSLGGSTVTIEGMPKIANHLKASIQANKMKNILLYAYAVSDPEKEDSLKMAENSVNKGGSTVMGNKAWSDSAANTQVSKVGLTTLDSILSQNPSLQNVLAMKIDIEGHEGRALQGATKLLAKYPPCYIMIEMNPEWLKRAGTPCDGVKGQLQSAGYGVQDINCAPHAWGMDTYFLEHSDVQTCLGRLKPKDPPSA
jgi:FkbM family methyltransferase